MQPAFWVPLTAFAAALAVTWWLVNSRISTLVLDTPNARSLHRVPVPRTGGIAVHAGSALAISATATGLPAMLWIALGILVLVSLFDDIRGIPPLWRLAAHALASVLVMTGLLGAHGAAMIVAATLATVWMTNLYNFMDGADGLAGGMAVAGFSFYGMAAWLSGSVDFALVNFSIAAAALGFLCFNFHPARIFLGDVGSVPLGFLVAALGVMGYLQGSWAWWYPLLVFAPFIADASVTLGRRVLRMEKIWQAHHDHYYQRLVRMGWGHRKTAFAEYGLMAASGIIALWGLSQPASGQIALLCAAAIVYLILIASIELGWRRHLRHGRP